MNIAILGAVLLSTTLAAAETIIIEYPDHFYVESAGIPEGNPAPPYNNSTTPATITFTADYESPPPLVTARPITSFDNNQQPVEPAERRDSMQRELGRLQREHSLLLAPQEGETSDQANRRQQEAFAKLKKINRISSELAKISGLAGE